MNWWLEGWARIAKESGKFNSDVCTQAKSQAGLTPFIYDTVRFK